MCTRQRKWQRLAQAEGKCTLCGKPAVNRAHCEHHREKQREYSRNKYRAAHGIPLDAPKHSFRSGKPVPQDLPEPRIRKPKLSSRDRYRLSVGIPLDAPKNSTYRGKPIRDSIISEPVEYRLLHRSERIQEGDEVLFSGSWLPSSLVGEPVGPSCVMRRRIDAPLVISCDTRIPTINLQPMKLQ